WGCGAEEGNARHGQARRRTRADAGPPADQTIHSGFLSPVQLFRVEAAAQAELQCRLRERARLCDRSARARPALVIGSTAALSALELFNAGNGSAQGSDSLPGHLRAPEAEMAEPGQSPK